MATRKEEIKKYNEAKKRYQEAYAKASDDVKSKIDEVMKQSRGRTSADPLNNRDSRQYATQMYDNALSILNGSYHGAPEGETPEKHFLVGYSPEGNVVNANNVTNNGLATPIIKAENAASNTSNMSNNSAENYFFNWQEGLGSGWGLDDETLEDRMQRYASTLADNLQNAANAQSEGKTMRQISDKQLAGLQGDINILRNLNLTDSKQGLKQLISVAQKYDEDGSHFKNFFGDLLPGTSPQDKARAAKEKEGYVFNSDPTGIASFDKYLSDTGYKFGTKDGKAFIFDPETYELIAGNPTTYIDDNYLDPNAVGRGYAINDRGEVIIGNMANVGEQNPFYQQIADYTDQLKTKNSEYYTYSPGEWNNQTDLSQSDLVNYLGQHLHGKKIIDVGRYFDGNVPVIATVKDNNIDAHLTQYGQLNLNDPAVQLYTQDPRSGKYIGGTYKQLQSILKKVNLHNDKESDNGTSIFESPTADLDSIILDLKKEGLRNNDDVNGASEFRNIFSREKHAVNGWSGEKIDTNRDIGKQRNELARFLLFGFTNQSALDADGQKTLQYFLANPQRFAYFINSQLKQNPNLFNGDARYKQAWFAFLKAYGNMLPSASSIPNTGLMMQKEGGIILAKEGVQLDLHGNPRDTANAPMLESYAQTVRNMQNQSVLDQTILEQGAKERGLSPENYAASKMNGWTTSDTLRAAALAQDVFGLVAAISGAATGGAGSIAAEVSGFTSMGTDLVANIMDDSMSAGQVIKHAAIDTGLALGAMFGAKAPSVIRKVTKIAPKLMGLASAGTIALDPQVHKSLGKVIDGEALDTQDWRNIGFALRAAVGLGRMGVGEYSQHKLNKTLESAKVPSDSTQSMILDHEGNPIKLNTSEVKAINSALKEGKIDTATTKLTAALKAIGNDEAKSKELAGKIIGANTGKRFKFWGKQTGELKLQDQETGYNFEELRSLQQAEEAAYNQKQSNSVFQRFLGNADEFSSKFIPGKGVDPRMSFYERGILNTVGATNRSEFIQKVNDEIDKLPFFVNDYVTQSTDAAQKQQEHLQKIRTDLNTEIEALKSQLENYAEGGSERTALQTEYKRLKSLQEQLNKYDEFNQINKKAETERTAAEQARLEELKKEFAPKIDKFKPTEYLNIEKDKYELFNMLADKKLLSIDSSGKISEGSLLRSVPGLINDGTIYQTRNGEFKLKAKTPNPEQYNDLLSILNKENYRKLLYEDGSFLLKQEVFDLGLGRATLYDRTTIQNQFNKQNAAYQTKLNETIKERSNLRKELAAKKKIYNKKDPNNSSYAAHSNNQILRDITVTNISGNSTIIKKGSSVTFLDHVKNHKFDRAPGLIQIDPTSPKIKSILDTAKGAAYDPNKNKLYIWKQGGKLNRYDHIRNNFK